MQGLYYKFDGTEKISHTLCITGGDGIMSNRFYLLEIGQRFGKFRKPPKTHLTKRGKHVFNPRYTDKLRLMAKQQIAAGLLCCLKCRTVSGFYQRENNLCPFCQQNVAPKLG